jgi:hypothetical protein
MADIRDLTDHELLEQIREGIRTSGPIWGTDQADEAIDELQRRADENTARAERMDAALRDVGLQIRVEP